MNKKVSVVKCDSYSLENVSAALDQMFLQMGLNPENPFEHLIKPGMKVFIKPNWVASRWRASCDHVDDLYSVITHPSVIEAVADRAALALKGEGEIVIADNPSIDADFEELMEFTGIRKLEHKYDVPCYIYDLRPLVCPSLDVYGDKDQMVSHPGDPNGEVEVNLGRESLLYHVDSTLFRGVFNQREETIAAHTGEQQLYTYSASLYNSDVYISIPKLKTHQKVGATLNLKGLVGSITKKNQLVHWRVGVPETGGDEYPDKVSFDKAYQSGKMHRGSWPGNDTIWRMVVDLYQGLMMKPDRKCFTVIDGIVAGEGQGPFCPNAKQANTLIGADDLLASDIVAARYMGFDPEKLKYLKFFIDKYKISLDQDIQVIWNGDEKKDFFGNSSRYSDFKVMPLWQSLKFEANKNSE